MSGTFGKETYIIEQKHTVDNSELIKGNKKAKASTSALSGVVEGATGKINKLISPVNLGAVAVTALAFRTLQAVKNFASFEKQMSSVNVLLKTSRSELTAYGNGLIDIAIQTGRTKEELADGAYEALSAGVDSKELLNFMEVASKGASAGMTDVSTATDVLTSTLNGFKLESSDATETMDKLITIQNKGKIVLGEMSTVMGDVADISSSLGLDLDNVGAALSTITMTGTPAAQAGTRLKAMFSELAKEGTNASTTFKEITGKTFKEFITEGGNLGEALEEMQREAGTTEKEMIDLWGSVEAGQGAMGLTGANADTFKENLKALSESAGELETAYKTATDNISTEWTKLTSQLDKKWMAFVGKLEEPIKMTLKIFRKMAGDDSVELENAQDIKEKAQEEIDDLTAQISALESEIAEKESDTSWWAKKGFGGTESLKIKLENLKEHLKTVTWEYEKANNDIAEIEAKNSVDTPKNDNGGGGKKNGSGNDDDGDDKKTKEEEQAEHLEKLKALEQQYKEDITAIDIEILNNKKSYQDSLNEQLEAGLITETEYNEKLEAYNSESSKEQDLKYKEALEKLKGFYEDLGELSKANDLEKQILEIEVKLTGLDGEELLAKNEALREFQAQQEEELKSFNNSKLISEWEFLEELGALRLAGQITEEEFNDRKNDFYYNQAELEAQNRISQLEDLRDFYLAQEDMQKEAQAVQEQIFSEKQSLNSKEKKVAQTKNKWEEWAEGKKVDIQEQSADAVLDVYNALASGQIEDLDAFKDYCKEKIAELLQAKGQEHMAEGISDTAIAVSTVISDPPLSASKFVGAAQHFAAAALFGAASSAFSSSSSSSSDSSDDTDYEDDEDVTTAEETASSSTEDSVQIYVSTEENSMAKAMVEILEQELNDEYNVSIIGNKK